jgi:hypothetical protein
MRSTYGQIAVQDFLELFGFTVMNIPEVPEQQREMPDYLVEDGEIQYIVEVKDKEDQNFIELIDSKGPGEKTITLGHRNRISGIIKKGVEQLDSYEKIGERLKILWFYIDDALFGGLTARQIAWTLYGLMEIEGTTRSNKYYHAGCFYFTYNDFHRYKQLDAVIIQRPEEIVLCINEFSHWYTILNSTKLYQLFRKENLVIMDPPQMEKDGRCFTAVDCNISRNDTKAIAEHIAAKYGLRQITARDFFLFNLPLDN